MHGQMLQDQPARERPFKGRRRYGRVRQDDFFCNLGEVVNISAGGMRVRCRWRPSKRTPALIRFKGFELPGPLFGLAVWSKRVGFFRHDVGIEFLGPSSDVLRQLTAIAGCGGVHACGDKIGDSVARNRPITD